MFLRIVLISSLINLVLFFAVLLVLMLLSGKLAIYYFGEIGLYLLAAVSGIADVDPVNLTLSMLGAADLSL